VQRTLPLLALVLVACEPSSGTILYPDATPPPGDDDDAADDDDDDDAFKAANTLVINELMPGNDSAVFDENGEAHDWLELFNPTDETIDLGGWTMTDQWGVPDLHTLATGLAIEPDGHLLLWASGLPDRGPDHLGFSLARRGEAIGLFDPDGAQVEWLPYPAVPRNVSWARIFDGWSEWEQADVPTPGGPN